MSLFSRFKGLFSRATKPLSARNYREAAAVGGTNSDWEVNASTEDAQIWQNNYLLRQRCRSLFDTAPFFRKYREELFANVAGENGITLRMKIKEESDRVVYTDEEKGAIERRVGRMDRIANWIGKKLGQPDISLRDFDPMEAYRAKGKIKAGALDVYANQLIERKWHEWQRAEYATASGRFTYNEIRQLRLLAAARDGDCFIRLIKDPKINKFGFSLQLIHAEWCDYNLNVTPANGRNEIRMGVELSEWGKPIAYHFIKRRPGDWQYAPGAGFTMQASHEHIRVDASEIIHYARCEYHDSVRPAPWAASVIGISRNLAKYVDAAVTAARAGACQSGFLYSDIVPQGGQFDGALPDPRSAFQSLDMAPGVITGLPYGIKYMANNPNNPNSEFGSFRKEGIREQCAGLPGANYNIQANDLEGTSYSSGRIGSLDEREMWKLIQRFDIDKAERPIFEAFLEMGLVTGEIPLPLKKLSKFNQPCFSGRRWQWVDPKSEAIALETELKNFLTSWSRIFADRGADLEEVWIERAEEQMLAEDLGIKLPTWDAMPEPEPEEGDDKPVAKKPAKKPAAKTNGQHPRREHILTTEN
jgi:lambda family phage portal protein